MNRHTVDMWSIHGPKHHKDKQSQVLIIYMYDISNEICTQLFKNTTLTTFQHNFPSVPIFGSKYVVCSNRLYPIECAIQNWIFVQGCMAFSVRWSTSLGVRRLVSLCESPQVQLHCEPNNILRPVEMCRHAKARLVTACLCYNSKKIP